jgi:hypothetical protein
MNGILEAPNDHNASKGFMMSAYRHTITVVCTALAAAMELAGFSPAIGSKPIPKTIVGCVFNGSFISSDGYDIHPRDANGEPVDLRPFEGRAMTISGALLPGDSFIVNEPPSETGPCRTARPTLK